MAELLNLSNHAEITAVSHSVQSGQTRAKCSQPGGGAAREREGGSGVCGSYSVIAIVALDKAKPKATALGKNILWKSGTID